MASFVGIDLSKDNFHAHLLTDHSDARKTFPNTSKGFERLVSWLDTDVRQQRGKLDDT
jgi:transposase